MEEIVAMREELEKLSKDIRKVQEAELLLSSVSTTKMSSEIGKLIDYALENNIIKSATDIVDLSLDNAEVKKILAEKYDLHLKKKLEKAKAEKRDAEVRYENRYAGTYNSWEEVPGYNKEWNMRCIPSGVVIRSDRCSGNGSNRRC